jgi:catechol 2,3-dioxygenase-like lactoylglutathione lyase family enzyme
MVSMIDHVSREVSDLERSARFYDAVFYALGARRMPAEPGAVAWGVDGPVFRILAGDARHGHVALRAAGKAAVDAAWEAGRGAGGRDDGAPERLPAGGIRCYRACLRDPDGARVELLSR